MLANSPFRGFRSRISEIGTFQDCQPCQTIAPTATASDAPGQPIAVSPDNPCPFLRAAVAAGFVDGHVVPLARLSQTVEAASGETGLNKKLAGLKTRLVALIANGLGPLRLLRSLWSGAVLDALRDGPLDKHGVGSRILDATAHVNEAELARLAEFGKDRQDPCGGSERGLTAAEIVTYMDANFERAKGKRRWIDRKLMEGEWPVLLRIMGKGEGDQRYLSVAEVRTLFVERRLPERINARLRAQTAPAGGVFGKLAKAAIALIAIIGAAFVAIAEFPDEVGKIVPPLAQLLPPPLPDRGPTKAAYWLDQNWSTEDRHWFHHASQGTATFPVPYAWFVALEQPGLHLVSRPGLLSDSDYLERFGFLPSPKSIHADAPTLRRFGYAPSPDAKTEPAPDDVFGLRPTAVENFDGLPVGFARLTGVANPGTGQAEPDRIGLTCAACHTGSIRYKGIKRAFRRRSRHGGTAQARKRHRPVHSLHPESAGPLRPLRRARARPGRQPGRTRQAEERPGRGRRLPAQPEADLRQDDQGARDRRTPTKASGGSTR